jgi:hypothetical protein
MRKKSILLYTWLCTGKARYNIYAVQYKLTTSRQLVWVWDFVMIITGGSFCILIKLCDIITVTVDIGISLWVRGVRTGVCDSQSTLHIFYGGVGYDTIWWWIAIISAIKFFIQHCVRGIEDGPKPAYHSWRGRCCSQKRCVRCCCLVGMGW